MNKAELIELISTKTEMTKASVTRMLDVFLEAIVTSLKRNDPVVLVGLGSFIVKQRAAREGRNPSTGEKIKIKAAKVVGFKAGKALKDAVKEQEANK